MKNDDATILATILGGFIVIGIAAILMFSGGESGYAAKCAKSGCNSERDDGSIYCWLHRSSSASSSSYSSRSGFSSSSKSSSYSSGSSIKSSSSSYGSSSSTKSSSKSYNSSSSSKSSTSKKKIFHDPADYDDPDDYADDAWGSDFDTWDEAYDYWEDY